MFQGRGGARGAPGAPGGRQHEKSCCPSTEFAQRQGFGSWSLRPSVQGLGLLLAPGFLRKKLFETVRQKRNCSKLFETVRNCSKLFETVGLLVTGCCFSMDYWLLVVIFYRFSRFTGYWLLVFYRLLVTGCDFLQITGYWLLVFYRLLVTGCGLKLGLLRNFQPEHLQHILNFIFLQHLLSSIIF